MFFFNDTATTEFYTYCHPFSLHDALPICAQQHRRFGRPGIVVDLRSAYHRGGPGAGVERRHGPALGRVGAHAPIRPADDAIDHTALAVEPDQRRKRSEEHTSELQSLMRISYAVFCLIKKNHITHFTILLHT